ncbi:restriction endonuclease subunit S [Nonomuraea sp. NPDC050786]|uniref:restriction endonuclease subunit S n=1 Tax=Nonomuraea sp. NPDC050786 TaxID=3154840 RepID=UPI0033C494AA
MTTPAPSITKTPYVRQQDVINGTVLVDQLAHTSTDIASKRQRTALREGDVLLCIIRNLRVAIVAPGIDGANITQGMVRIRPGSNIVGKYLAYYLSAPSTQQRMRDQYVGLAMPRINVRDARGLIVDLPPLDEQREIVRRVDELLKIADRALQKIDDSSTRLERAGQVVLAKAFRGELLEASE